MSKWVRELLLASSPSTDVVEEVDPVGVVLEAIDTYEMQIRTSGVEVEFTASESSPVVSQRVLHSQVLNSLFSNALEAMPQGGKLSIDLEENAAKGELLLKLTDTGTGMTPGQRQKLFQPFSTNKQGGLGVGLVMVKRIMERFGGSIAVSNRHDCGTQVCLAESAKCLAVAGSIQ